MTTLEDLRTLLQRHRHEMSQIFLDTARRQEEEFTALLAEYLAGDPELLRAEDVRRQLSGPDLSTRLEDLSQYRKLPTHTKDCLKGDGIITLSQLAEKSAHDLRRIRFFGRISLNQVREMLKELGLKLKDN